jgi:ABC-type transport system involved in multi-copper enzyme maturation permease subunit
MNLALLRKELHGAWICVPLAVALHLIGWAELCLNHFPDRPLPSKDAVEPWESALLLLIIGLVAGVLVMGHEKEHKTQSFMDSLAVSRHSVFLHKALAALLLMACVVLVFVGDQVLSSALLLTSMDPTLPWKTLLAKTGLMFVLAVAIVGIAMVISFTGKFFALATFILIIAIVASHTMMAESASLIDSSALLTPQITSAGELVLPWRQITGYSIVAAASFGFAGLLFNTRDSLYGLSTGRKSSTWVKVGVGIVATGAVGFAGLLLDEFDFGPADFDPITEVAGTPNWYLNPSSETEFVGFASRKTLFYEVIFKDTQEEQLFEIGDSSFDVVHEDVMAYFQNPELPNGLIVVDVASAVSSHAAGVTNWTKIRVPLIKSKDYDDFVSTLRHETAHVFIEQLSGGFAGNHMRFMRTFHEGIATAVELSVNDDLTRKALERMHAEVALAVSRGRVSLDELCDDSVLTKKYNSNLAYSFGLIFAESLIDAGGPSLPRRVLASLERSPPRVSTTTTSAQFWQHILQDCEVSREFVIAAYEARLDELSQSQAAFVDRFPRLNAVVSVERGEIIIRPSEVPMQSPDLKMVCYVEVDTGIAKEQEPVDRGSDGAFRISRSAQSGNKVRYLLGWLSPELDHPVFEPWAEAVIK